MVRNKKHTTYHMLIPAGLELRMVCCLYRPRPGCWCCKWAATAQHSIYAGCTSAPGWGGLDVGNVGMQDSAVIHDNLSLIVII